MKTVLLTAFEPFGGHASNPSELVANHLNNHTIEGHRIVGSTLACEFGKSLHQLKSLLHQFQPSLVICLGLAENRADITPERIAINEEDARIPDNAGYQPISHPVVPDGPAGYWSTLPIKAIVAALRSRQLPASISYSAGTFVCNHVFYGLMHELTTHSSKARAGFIHIPPLRSEPHHLNGLTLDQLTTGISLAIETSIRNHQDLRTTEGTIS
ncbi:MAG: hypothetical protein RI897_2118 [Verrucomicrobiota bacterium]|jgi:pyroglutamyl-peptidase